MFRFVGIPVLLEFPERCDQRDRSLDRVDTARGLHRVHWRPAQVNLHPDDADLRGHQLFVEGLGNQGRISGITALQARKRTVAGAFFLDHRLDIDVGGRLITGVAQRVECVQISHQPCLHVAGAAAVHPAIVDPGFIRRAVPHVERPFGHDVDVAVQDQRLAVLRAAAVGRDHVQRLVVIAEYR